MEKRDNIYELYNAIRGELPLDRYMISIISYAYVICCEKRYIRKDDAIYDWAREIIDHLPNEKANRITNLLNELPFEGIQDYVYAIISDSNNEIRYNEASNDEISTLAYKLLELDEGGDIVYDMGSGNGNFLANILKKTSEENIILKDVIGKEINTEKAIVSKMVLSILNYGNNNAIIKDGNVLDGIDYPYTKGFVFPPLGMKILLGDKGRMSRLFPPIEFTNRNSGEWVFIDQLLSGIDGNWKAVAFVTGRALFNDADKAYRTQIIRNGLLESIIELPSGALTFTGIKPYILVFSRNNKKVKLVDASNVLLDERVKRFNQVKLPVEKILGLYNDKKAPCKTISELKDLDNITPSIVLLDVKPMKNGVPLSDVAEVFVGNQYTLGTFEKNGMLSDEETGYRILTSLDIEDGAINWKKLKSIKYEDSKFDKYAVKYNDVIITSKSSKVKIAVVDIEPKEKILVTGGMLIVRPDTSKLDPTYLKIYLDSSQGQIALKSIQKGEVIVTISSKGLATISIPLIDIDKQHFKAVQYKNKLSTLTAYKNEIRKIEDSLKDFLFMDEEEE